MLGAAQWFALVGMIAISCMFVMELMKWRSPENVITGRHKTLRVVLVVLIELLFVLIWLGGSFAAKKDIITELIYWTICLMFGLAIFVLAIFDLREVGKAYSARNRRALNELLNSRQRDIK